MMEGNCAGEKDINADQKEEQEEEEEVVLPGFRFHPTDEELVGFYLLRKVQGKSMNIELITQVDIYKYDPWDLPKLSNAISDEKEWYFFCMRGRKYRNSGRPNRVTATGTGFWKATGIDKPIYSSSKCNTKYCIIGLKKSLVYYRGNAGKGTKTDWMMHEFRLPPTEQSTSNQEAEVWTLCRIFKRNAPHKKCTPKWEHPINKKTSLGDSNSTTCSLQSTKGRGDYINNLQEIKSNFTKIPEEISIVRSPITSSSSSLWTANGDEFFRNGNWDELGPAIDWGLTNHSNFLWL